MKRSAWLALAGSLLVAASWTHAETIAGLPLHVATLGEGVVRVWLGDSVSSTAQVAFATARGIVVVDTVGFPALDAELRKVIARELGRSDFAVLINTHEHGDHTGGNSVYADCDIVGHELVGAGMRAARADRPRVAEFMVQRVAELEKQAAGFAAGSADAKRAAEELAMNRLSLDDLRSTAEPLPPRTTFSDRMTLDMGDATFELSFIGGMHSSSDIAVFVPEHGLLLTGDTMADVWLTDTPGCLASFGARPGVRHDFPRMLANWERLLSEPERIKMLVPGHWNGELSPAGAAARVAYVRALWEGVGRAVAEGNTLPEVQAGNRLADRFPDLATSPGFSPRGHWATVVEMWKEASGQESAAQRLVELIDEEADEAAVRELLAERSKPSSCCFFLEAEVNAYGYGLLQQGKVDKAVAMFRINVELFPESWNVYDSLGEALAAAGDVAAATAMYEKSLQLNPESPSGRQALERLRATPQAE